MKYIICIFLLLALIPSIGLAQPWPCVSLQRSDGNPVSCIQAYGTYFAAPNNAALNIFDTDHTITFVEKLILKNVLALPHTLMEYGVVNTSGIIIATNSSHQLSATYHGGGSSTSVPAPMTALNDNNYRVVQIVRGGSSAKTCIDGVCGASTDVTGRGIDAATDYAIGGHLATAMWYGDILFHKLTARALTDTELTSEREKLTAIYNSSANRKIGNWTTTRTSAAYQTDSTGHMTQQPANKMRVAGKGGGVLIEAQGINLHRYSQTLNTWSTKTRVTVIADASLPKLAAPDGAYTADKLREDRTAANTHLIDDSAITVVNGAYYTFSVYAKKMERDWIALYSSANPAAYGFFDLEHGRLGSVSNCTSGMEPLADGRYRVWITYQTSSTSNTQQIYIAEADTDVTFNGLNQDSLLIYGTQFELGQFPTSYIPTTTGQAVRTADRVSAPYSVLSLPDYIGYGYPTSKLTFKFDAKCPYSGSTDVGTTKGLLSFGKLTGTAWGYLRAYISDAGVLTFHVYKWDSFAPTNAYAYSVADVFDYSEWHTYEFSVDLDDLSTISMLGDGVSVVNSTAGATGHIYLKLSGSLVDDPSELYVGSGIPGSMGESDCRIRNLSVDADK